MKSKNILTNDSLIIYAAYITQFWFINSDLEKLLYNKYKLNRSAIKKLHYTFLDSKTINQIYNKVQTWQDIMELINFAYEEIKHNRDNIGQLINILTIKDILE